MPTVVDHLQQVSAVASGDGFNAYAGQIFVAEGSALRSIEFLADLVTGGATAAYRVLVTTVNVTSNGFHPGAVLFESAQLTLPIGGGFQKITVDTGNLALVPGQTYAFIFDSATDRASPFDEIDIATGLASYAGGYAVQQTGSSSQTRAQHFASDWSDLEDIDLAFRLVFTNPGVTITGTKKDDRVDAAKSIKGQPLPTELDDTILGRGGEDKLSALGGEDIIDGGKQRDTLAGGNGGDSFLFSVGLQQRRDKILDFNPIEDSILLSVKIFANLSPGALSEAAFRDIGEAASPGAWIRYKANGVLTYDADGVGGNAAKAFAKLAAVPDISAADLIAV